MPEGEESPRHGGVFFCEQSKQALLWRIVFSTEQQVGRAPLKGTRGSPLNTEHLRPLLFLLENCRFFLYILILR